jgi:predicted nuclease with TOPRIM domain
MRLLTDILKGLPENAVLRDKVRDLEAKQAGLETENAILKDDLRKAQAETTKLKERIEELTHKEDELNENELEILKVIGTRTGRVQMFAANIAHKIKVDLLTTEYHLQRLVDRDYIRLGPPAPPFPGTYDLEHKGREYIVKNKIL